MKRLSSYWTYPYVFSYFFFDVLANYYFYKAHDYSFKVLFLIALLNLIFITGFVLSLDYKRMYLKGQSLYVYDLYPSKPYIFSLSQLKSVDRVNSPHIAAWGIYKATFTVDGGYFAVEFMKNKLIWDLRKYI